MQPKFTLKKVGFFFKLPSLLLILLSLSAGKVNAQCSWTASTVFPIPIMDQGVVTVGSNLYSFAGVSNGAVIANSYRFDGTTWTAIAPTPQGLEYPAAVTDGTNVYLLGGASTVGTPLTTLYRYNVAANTYTTLASFTTGIWNTAAVYLNGKIYKIAGTGPGTGSSTVVEIYDVASNTWSLGAAYPTAASFVSIYTNGTFIYTAGGINAGTGVALTKAYRYDPVTNTWDDPSVADLPVDRWGAANSFYFNSFVMAGGYVAGAISPTAIAWSPGTNTWFAMPDMLGLRSRFNGAILGGAFYALGGRNAGNFIGTPDNQRLFCAPCVSISSITIPAVTNTECSASVTITSNVQPGNASVQSYSWEYRVNPSMPWLTAGNGGLGGVISGATTANLTLVSVPSSLNGYQFRSVVTPPLSCGVGLDFSNATTLNVGPLVARVTPASAAICLGDIVQLSLPSPASTFSSGPINLPVPDFNPVATTSSLTVAGIPGAAIITSISVSFSMMHTYPGDMIFNLKAPNGQILNLYKYNNGFFTGAVSVPTAGWYNAVCNNSSSTAYSAVPTPYMYGITPPPGPYKPDARNTNVGGVPFQNPNGYISNANAFLPDLGTTGAAVNGVWTLAMADGGPGDLGTLTSWSISIGYGAPITGIWTSQPAAPNTMFIDPAATIPYPPGTPVTTIWVKPAVNTNYSVIASTTTPPCTSAPTIVPVTVNTPLSNLVNPTNKTVCVGSNTSFTASATGGPFTYQWQESKDNGLTWNNLSDGGVYSGTNTGTLTLTGVTRAAPVDMNNYRYRVIMSSPPCPGTFTTSSALLTVLALPSVTITASDLALTPGQTSTITGTSNPAPLSSTSWSWTLNGSTIAGALTNSVTADINKLGVYRAWVTDVNGCFNGSNSVLIEAEASDRLWIYPNPTTGKFEVRWYYPGILTEKRRVTIFNSVGQKLMTKDFPMTNVTPHYLSMQFDLSGLQGGVYVVNVVDIYDKKIATGLVIKQ